MNQKKINDLSERIFNETVSAMSCLTLYLGHRLNLFQSIFEAGPITSIELSKNTGYSERYLREWLECMAVLDYIEYDPTNSRFSISPEHAEVLCNRDSSAYTIPFVHAIPSLSSVVSEKLVHAFRTGQGVSYEDYGADLIEAQGEGNRPMFIHNTANWISSMPDIEAKLKSKEGEGARIADIGCGDGWASIALAKSFPLIKIDAIDPDIASIENARKNVNDHNLSDRISLYSQPIEELTSLNKGRYDLVIAFECIHDMPYPVKALRKMRDMLSPNGCVLVADVKVGEKLEEKNDFVGKFYYNFSVLLCLPQSLVYPNSKGTGAAMAPSTFYGYAKEAGFSKIEILSVDHFLWNFYRLTP